jgi:hypothetical protein
VPVTTTARLDERHPSRLVAVIDWYQRATEGRPSPCRFSPSCSAYAREALEIHGGRRGLWLAVRRLARCRPFGPSGFDPVPEPVPSAPAPSGDRVRPMKDDCCR